MDSVQQSVTGTVYQQPNSFSTQFKSAMQTEGVDNSVVTSMSGVVPDETAQAVEQEIDEEDVPAGTSNDASGATDKKDSIDMGILFGVIGGIAVLAFLAGVVFLVIRRRKNKQPRRKLQWSASKNPCENPAVGVELNSNPMKKPAVAIVTSVTTTNLDAN
jgi:hypothetical protein